MTMINLDGAVVVGVVVVVIAWVVGFIEMVVVQVSLH